MTVSLSSSRNFQACYNQHTQKSFGCFLEHQDSQEIFRDEISMQQKFDSKNFTIHLGGDGLIYSTCKSTSKLFVHNGYEWMDFDEFILLPFQPLDAMLDEETDF